MSPITPPANLQAASYPARIDRLDSAALLTSGYGIGPLAGRAGVKPGAYGATSGLQVTQRAVPDRYVTVGPGTCYIQAASALGGTYICHNDASYDVQTAASHPTLPRIDLIIARVYDAVDDVGSQNTFAIESVTGTAAASPVAPPVPGQSHVLAQVAVAAASTTVVTANITDLRARVVALGGILPCRDAADVPASPHHGMTIFREDLGYPQMYRSGAWVPLGTVRIATLTAATPLSNTAAETLLGTIPGALEAGVPVNGTYKGFLCGICNGTTATPTFTLKAYLDSAAGTLLYAHAVTYQAAGGVRQWDIDCKLQVSAAGASGQLRQSINWVENVSVSGGASSFIDTSTHTVDLTVKHDLVITGQFSAASGTNTASMVSGVWERA
jgi:hypothetical protein